MRRVRVIQQMETTECGPACLAMVLDYHGHSRSLPEMREACGSSRNGHSALELLQVARGFGLEGNGISLDVEALGSLAKPAILHWGFNHFVVLERYKRGKAVIVDPANGRRRVSKEELGSQFSGVALELRPGRHLTRRKREPLRLARYIKPLLEQRTAVLFVLIANVAQQVLALSVPAASQVLIDHVIQPRRDEWILPVLLVLAGATLVQIVLEGLQGTGRAVLHSSVGAVLAERMGDRLLRLPLPFLESRSHGDLMERVNMQAELQGLLANTVHAFFDVLFLCLLLALMIAYDPFLGGLSALLACARLVLLRWLRRPIAQQDAAELAARGREAGGLAEATMCMEMTKGFGVGQRMKERYSRRVRRRIRWSLRSAKLEVGVARVTSLLDAVMHATILWLGGQQVIAGEMTLGVFAGFLAIRAMVTGPMSALVALAENWIRARGVLERCEDILGMPPIDQRGERLAISGRIDIKNVGFRYHSGGAWVFRNVNLSIRAGQHVALVGPSGEGKSTLGKILCGLLEPTEGQVLLDGRDIRGLDKGALARQLGVVLQEPLILEGSVYEALTLKDPACAREDALLAAHVACFDAVVHGLDNGYQSRLAAMGANLSGGERQRLAIAQAVLGSPRILLLDEATCSLDAALETKVMDRIASLGATTVSIAHRTPIITRAERVVEVADGLVSERFDRPSTNLWQSEQQPWL